VNYEREGDALLHAQEIDPTHRLTFRAEAIRQERTGVHARVSVAMNGVTLAYDLMNVEKDEDRVHLSNAYYKHLNGLSGTYPKDFAKKDLDLFCHGLWEAMIGGDVAEYVGGFDEPRPPVQVIKDFLLDGGGSLLFGPPERGKSWMLMLMAVSVDAGCSTLWPVVPKRSLFINLERSRDSVLNRLGLINRALGLPANRRIHMMNRRGRSLADIYSAAKRSVADFGIEAVFLDSITRAGAGDLTENGPANRICDMMNGLSPSWMGIAHTPRNDDSHVYGSQMFDGGADILIRTFGELRGDERGVGLLRTKGNDLPSMMAPHAVALRFAEEGLIAVRGAKLAEFPQMLVAGRKETTVDTVIRYLQEGGAASATEVARETGLDRSIIARMFTDSPLFVRTGKVGREVLYGIGDQV
jgi:hypothetical protein